MYMNNYRPRYGRMFAAVGGILLAVCLLFCEMAAASDLYQEVLKFDSYGNLQMTTHDKRATGGVKYRTIGWTIKRWAGVVPARARALYRSGGQRVCLSPFYM